MAIVNESIDEFPKDEHRAGIDESDFAVRAGTLQTLFPHACGGILHMH